MCINTWSKYPLAYTEEEFVFLYQIVTTQDLLMKKKECATQNKCSSNKYPSRDHQSAAVDTELFCEKISLTTKIYQGERKENEEKKRQAIKTTAASDSYSHVHKQLHAEH